MQILLLLQGFSLLKELLSLGVDCWVNFGNPKKLELHATWLV